MTSEATRLLSAQTGAQQTMSAWAKVIDAREAVPAAYRPAYDEAVGNEPDLPFTVWAPALPGLRRPTTEKLLCAVRDTVYVWEKLGGQVTTTAYPFDAISDLETGNILLFSWITLGGVTTAGTSAATTIEFNTATSRHFAWLVNRLRPAPRPLDEPARQREGARLDFLAADSFKFMSFGRASLGPGAHLHSLVWQPPRWQPALQIGGWTLTRSLSLGRLVLLTDQELIVIEDDERSRTDKGVRYGGKWRYLALDHIGGAELSEPAAGQLVLSLSLVPGGRRCELRFPAAHQAELAELLGRLAARPSVSPPAG
ncbi:MAG: hypothetical protein JNK29_00825 [Anaerolineales bacterium]|nr:hypothetical protein [Anaerolineales bacterium]